jgi:autotransporter-associated beta strand protein
VAATATGLLAFVGGTTGAATHVDVGAVNLLPNTPNQVVTLQVTNDVGTTPQQVTDFAGYFQIGPNTLDQAVPVFQGADFTNTFWGPGSAGGVGPEPGLPQLMQKGFSLEAGSVAADGNLINLVVDTTGITSGTFDLKLTNNAYTDVFGNSSSFLPGTANAAITLNNGSITIVAGPSSWYWDTNGTTAGAGGATPGGNWDGTTANFNSDSAGGGGTLTAAPAATDTVVFSAGGDATGSYTVNLTGTRAAGAVNVEEGSLTLAGGTLATGAIDVAAGAAANVSSTIAGGVPASLTKTGAGTLTLAAVNSHTAGTTVSAGTLVLANADATAGGAINVADGATAHAQASLPKAITVSTLTTNASGKFDLTNNAMVVKGMTVAQVQALIQSAFNAGQWNGATGLTSSTAATASPAITAIGIASNGVLNKSEFKGVTGLTATDVLVKYTYYGDSDLNGATTLDDYTLFLNGYQTAGTTWVQGDYDYNGQVTLDDFTLFLAGYQQQGTPLSELESLINGTPMSAADRAAMLAAVQAVPEPAAAGMVVGLAGLALAHRRRRSRQR